MSRSIWGRVAVSVLLGLAGCFSASAQEKLSYVDLVRRMTDLEGLAKLPQPGERCAQWSSYDRASKYDAAAGKYIGWDANGDGGGIIRTEGDKQVLAEMEGPGCIWRIWSADAGKGHIRIYLDGQEKPAVDMPFFDFFTGKQAPFNFPALSYRLEDCGCRGQDLYYPIPYQKSCKIVADKNWGNYYHFGYSTYPKGTEVPTFKTNLADEDVAALKEVNSYFQEKMGKDPAGRRKGQETVAKVQVAAAGSKARIVQLDGPRAVTAIRVKFHIKDRAAQIAALRKLALQITWDDQSKPAVWCPLGDFFGTAPGVNLYKTLPTGMTADGFYALWYMPFAKKALFELVNDSETDVPLGQLEFQITSAPLANGMDGLAHFHAKWHRDVFPVSKDRWPDWTMLKTEGQGRFCGVMLHIWNPRGGWWGEGDEKFFVDGEKFPSTIGTGSEDYFGYAWGDGHLFQKPYHAQTMTEDNNGHQSLIRWHIADNVPFQKSFEGCIEKYFNNKPGTLYACTTVWYLAPGGKDPFEAVPAEERFGYWNRPLAVKLKVLGKSGGSLEDQIMAPFSGGKWRDDVQLFWTQVQPKDRLDLAVPVAKAGMQDLSIIMTNAPDYGIVQLYLDGKKLGEPIDLFGPAVVPTKPIALGRHDLSAGEHKMTVEIVGANPKAIKSYLVGIDEILVKPAP